MTTFWRKIFRWRTLLVLAAGIVVLLAVLLVVAHTPWVRTIVLHKVEAYLRARFNVELSAKSLGYNVFDLTATLRGVTMARQGSDLPPLFRADKVSVRVPLALISRGELRFRKVTIEQPRIEVVFGPGGASNIPEFPEDPTLPPLTRLPPLVLESFELSGGTFALSGPSAGERVVVAGLALTVRWTGQGHALRLEAGAGGTMEIGRTRLAADSFRLAGTFTRDDANVEDLSVKLGGSRVSLNGQVHDLFRPNFQATLQADLQGPDLGNAFGLRNDLEGRFEVRADLEGPLKAMKARGTIKGSHAGYGPWLGADVQADFRWSPGSLAVSSFEVSSPHGDIKGSLEYAAGAGGRDNSLEMTWSSLDLGLLSRALGSPMLVDSLSTGKAWARWAKSSLSTLEAETELTLTPLSAAATERGGGKRPIGLSGLFRASLQPSVSADGGASKVRAEGRLRGSGTEEFTLRAAALIGERNLDVTSLDLAYSGGALAVSGRLPLGPGGGPLALSVKGQAIDIGKTAAFFGRSVPVDGTLTLDMAASGTRERPGLQVRIDAANLTYLGREIGGAAFSGKTADRRLNFELTLPSFAVSATGTLGLSSPYDLRGKLDIQRLSLDSLLQPRTSGFGSRLAGSLTGVVDFSVSLARMKQTLKAEASFGEVSFGLPGRLMTNQGPVRFAFDGKALTIEQMNLAGGGSEIRVGGRLPAADQPGGELTVQASLDLSLTEVLVPALAARGKLGLSSTITGTLASPVVALDADISNAGLRIKSVGTPVEELNLKASVRGNEIEIERAAFRWGKASADLSGTFPLGLVVSSLRPVSGPTAFRLEGKVAGLDPAEVGAALSVPALSGTTGVASFDFDLGGGSLDWNALAGHLRFSELRFTLGDFAFSEIEPARISVDGGQARIESLKLSGQGTSFALSGGLDFASGKFSGLALTGELQLALLRPFLKTGEISGISSLEILVSGDLAHPELNGSLGLKNVEMRWPDYSLSVSGLSGSIELEGQRLRIKDLRGEVNRGRLSVEGFLDWHGRGLSGADVQISADSVLTDHPQGFLAEWDLALRFTSDGRRQKLDGKASLIQGEYTENFDVRSGLFSLLKGGGTRVYVERSPFFDNMTFDVDITTVNPFNVRNNLADIQVRAALKLSGKPYSPGLGGSVLVLDGGTVTFAGNTYQVEQGRIDFVNPNRIEPNLALQATTTVSGYAIKLSVTGTPENLQATFTSVPVLAEADILSLLTVGVPLQGAAPSSSNGLPDQALLYLESAVTGKVGKVIARGLGLSTLTLDTRLVAPGGTPEARITVGQHLTPKLDLVLSQDLRNSNQRTVILNYAPTRRLNFQALNKDSNEYRFSVQGELRIGRALPAPARLGGVASEAGLKVGLIRLSGDPGLPEKTVRKHFPLKTGRKFNFLAYDKALRKLKDLYRKSGHLDLALKVDRKTNDGRVDITLDIRAGTRFVFEGRGFTVSKKLRKRLEVRWMQETFAGMKLGDVERTVRAELCSSRYYRATVKARSEEAGPGLTRVVIEVEKGKRYAKPHLEFSGRTAFKDKTLRQVLGSGELYANLFLNPGDSSQTLREYYREHGYLEARVGKPDIAFEEAGRNVNAVFAIKEGPLFHVGDITFEGNRFFDRVRLLKAAGFATGDVFRLEKFDRSRSILLELYESNGFISAAVEARVRPDAAAGTVSLSYKITEDQQGVIEAVQISGNRLTRSSFVREVLAFKPGDVVDYRKINESRRNLYDLGVFRTLSLDLERPPATTPAAGAEAPGRIGRQPYLAKLELSEAKPVDLVGGLQYDTETSVGGNLTLVHENLLGRALALGGTALLDSREQAGRVFIRSQYFLGAKADTNMSVFYDRKAEPDFTLRKYGATLQQQRRYRDRYLLTYDYTIEWDRTLSADAAMNGADRIGRVSASLAYDSRDNFLNPTKGRFLYQTLEYGDKFLGSQFRYVRSFGQASFYFRLSPVFLLASAARLGIESGFGQGLPLSLRFFAGGSTTVRGYGFHELGPKDPVTGAAVGGEAMLVLNEELRFPLYKIVGGVVFLDMGNVYPSLSRVRPLSLRSGAGFGLRLTLGALIGRLDMGFKLAPRAGESPYRLYVSIGQSF